MQRGLTLWWYTGLDDGQPEFGLFEGKLSVWKCDGGCAELQYLDLPVWAVKVANEVGKVAFQLATSQRIFS